MPTGREGYLMIDHRASPGVPEDVARATGFDPRYMGEGKFYEADTLTCSHCKCAQVKNLLRTRPRAYCAKCNGHYICDICAVAAQEPTYIHTSFDRLSDVYRELAARETLGSPSALLNNPSKVLIP